MSEVGRDNSMLSVAVTMAHTRTSLAEADHSIVSWRDYYIALLL